MHLDFEAVWKSRQKQNGKHADSRTIPIYFENCIETWARTDTNIWNMFALFSCDLNPKSQIKKIRYEKKKKRKQKKKKDEEKIIK